MIDNTTEPVQYLREELKRMHKEITDDFSTRRGFTKEQSERMEELRMLNMQLQDLAADSQKLVYSAQTLFAGTG